MKYTIFLALSLLSISCQSQIYPLDTSTSDIPNGAYIKDTNNELNPYIGLWKTNWNGNTIYLDLRKIKKKTTYPDGTYIYKDRIYGERKIVNNNGGIEIDNIINFNISSPEFMGISSSLSYSDYKTIFFYPKDMCNKRANLDVKFLNPQKTQMQMKFSFEPSFLEESCQYYNVITSGVDLPINWPKEDIVFTKQ